MTEKKAANGGEFQSIRLGSIPPALPPTSDPVVPSSDSIGLPGPSSKKLFPLFDTKARKNGKAALRAGNSSTESTATLSDSSQSAAKTKKKTSSAASQGTSRSSGASSSKPSDASSAVREKPPKPPKASQDKHVKASKTIVKSKKKSKSPRLSIDLEDPNATISTVASTSTASTTPPPEPHKTIITITDSPVREFKTTKTFADFEAERLAKKIAKEASGWNGGREPLWPSKANIHILPNDTTFGEQQKPSWVKRDWKGKGRAVENDANDQANPLAEMSPDHIKSILLQYTTLERLTTSIDNYARGAEVGEDVRHRLSAVSQNNADHEQQSWYTRYAPTKAADVLGDENKENALYLRDWLRELTLQDPLKVQQISRKRKIKRTVTSDERKKLRKAAKRRKRKGYDGYEDDDLQDFIASDDEEEFEHYDYYDLPDDASVPSPTKSTSSHGSHRRGRFEPLTNVILLTGPVSSGKTSTVYAVANELQWQVFEVYPGIGKRGYKDLDRYVGMVGENHIMKKENPPASAFFKMGTSKASASASTSTTFPTMNGANKAEPLAVSSSETTLLPPISNEGTVKQSCILIEEVDVLFESDSGFWEGLVSLIARSRRPVILTCNDVGAVPKDLLPLQNILYFGALEKDIVRSLLTEIARCERKEVTANLLDHILEADGIHDGHSDVRQAINQLQYVLSGPAQHPQPSLDGGLLSPEKHDLRQVERVLDIASFADAELCRRSWMSWEDEERVAQPTKEDDEFLPHQDLPVHKLDPPSEPDPSQPLPILAREAEFCDALGVPDDGNEDNKSLSRYQWKMCLGLHEVAEEYLDGAALLPGSTFLHTDVLPMLREMVNGDDQQEQAYNIALDIQADDVVLDARVRRSRRLAGSGKEGYRRHLDMSGEIANALRGSALPVQSNHTDNTGEVSNDSKDTIEGRDNSQNSERECEYRNAGAP